MNKLSRWFFRISPLRKGMVERNLIFTFGLDRAGKTVVSNYFATGVILKDFRPTLALNFSKLILVDIALRYCDAPGQKTLRKVWESSYKSAFILIFMLDTADHVRYEEAKTELLKVLNNPQTANVPLIFMFHKMDLPEAKENLDFARVVFNLPELKAREVHFFETSTEVSPSLEVVKKKMIELVKKSAGLP